MTRKIKIREMISPERRSSSGCENETGCRSIREAASDGDE